LCANAGLSSSREDGADFERRAAVGLVIGGKIVLPFSEEETTT
jgi:hypothetical protein